MATASVPTAELFRVAALTRDHLQGQIAAHPQYRYALAIGTGAISAGIRAAEALSDPGLQRSYLVGALNGGGEQLRGALGRHPEIGDAIPDLMDDALACISIARAAKEAA